MDEVVEEASAELAEMLAQNDAAARYVDPCTLASRFSLLKQMALSPAHYRYAAQQPQDDSLAARLGGICPPGTPRSEALRVGTAGHALLFNTGTIAVFEGKQRRGKDWEAFQRAAADEGHVEILNRREHALVTNVVDAIKRDETAMRLLFDGTTVEQRIDWTWEGRAFRSTPDARRPRKWCVDLKTAFTAEPWQFARHAARMFYHVQGAIYLDALDAIGETVPDDEYYIVVVEKKPPFPTVVRRLTPDTITEGRKIARRWFELLKSCQDSNAWPSYAVRILDLDVDPIRAANGGEAEDAEEAA